MCHDADSFTILLSILVFLCKCHSPYYHLKYLTKHIVLNIVECQSWRDYVYANFEVKLIVLVLPVLIRRS